MKSSQESVHVNLIINWAVADLMYLQLIKGNKTDNTRPCVRDGAREEGGRGLMVYNAWGALKVD